MRIRFNSPFMARQTRDGVSRRGLRAKADILPSTAGRMPALPHLTGKAYVVLAALLLIMTVDCIAQQEITIEQAVSYAIKQNRTLAMLRLAGDSRQIGVDDAESQFAFTFTPIASLQKNDDSTTTDYGISATRRTILGTTASVQGDTAATRWSGGTNLYRDSVIITLDQPLLRSAGIMVNREPLTAAEFLLVAARRQIEMKKTDLIIQVAETYEDQLRLQTQIELEKMTAGRLDKLFRLTQTKERQGRATRTDTLRAEIKLGDARLNLARLQDQMKAIKADFAELLGFPPETEFTVLPYPVPLVSVSNAEVAVAVALSNRLDYAQILQDRQDAVRGVRIAKRNLLPDLGFQTSYQLNGEGDKRSVASQLDDDVWFFGLTLQSDLPLRSERNAVKQAKIGVETADLQIAAAHDAIQKEIIQAFSAYERSKSEIALSDKNYRLAKGRVESARRMFERGKGDSFSVSDAEDELKQAQADWLNAQTQASLTTYRLLRVTGTLIDYPQELKPGAVK